ncbi:MAG: outer membrane protein assembly factor BamA [Verrucomicrobiota bacterium]
MRSSNHLLAAVATVCVTASSLAQNPEAPVVKNIEVQYAGPVTISKERILTNMRTRVGQPYSPSQAEEDIRSLYATGSISNVRYYWEPKTNTLVVVVAPKPTVADVRLEGVSQVKTKALLKLISTKPKEQLTESNVEADRLKILNYYQEKGYKDTTVKSRVETNEKTNQSVVTFAVVEAGKTFIHRVKFEGNTTFKASVLRKVIKTKPHNLLSFITKTGRLENEQVADDVASLREFYQNHGYVNVQIGDPEISRIDNKPDVDLIFTVREGPQYHVGKVAVTGAQVFSTDEVGKQLKSQPGAVYSPKTINEDVKAVQDLYGARGYIDVSVVPVTAPAGTALNNVTYRIEEGTQSYVERVNISGNVRTKDKVIRRELAVAPGEVYNSVRVEASKARLQNLNYFERVDVFPSDTSLTGKKDLNVVVSEKQTGSFNVGAGFSSIDSLTGFVELTQSNFDITNWPHFTGGGERFRTRLQYGLQRKDFTVSLTEPYFLDYQLAVGGELYYRDANFLSSIYNQRNYGMNLFTRKAINEWLSWRVDYRLEQIGIYNVDKSAPQFFKDQAGNRVQSTLSPSLVYDTRDSVFLTREGTRAELSTYVAGGPLGGNVSVFGGDLEATHYFHLPWDTILILNGEAAAVQAWSGTSEVPVFDRLYLGGSNNLRGFGFRDVGPKEKGQPIGGTSLGRATVEYTFPVVDRVRGAMFYDTGFIGDIGHVASDVGIGVRLDLPIGPVRLDYGVPVQKDQNAGGSGKFNFNIGYQF